MRRSCFVRQRSWACPERSCSWVTATTTAMGVDQSPPQAVEWFRQAAQTGYPDAVMQLGLCYMYGHGTATDEKQAAELFQQAASAGNIRAMNELGLCYEAGRGVEKDIHRAAELYRQAAQSGMAAAQCNLGVLYREGLGVEQDDRKAAALFRASAGQALPVDSSCWGCTWRTAGASIGMKSRRRRSTAVRRDRAIPTEWRRWPGAMSTASGWSATPIWRRISMTGQPPGAM